MDTNELQLKCKDAELFLGKCVLGKEVHTMKLVAFLKGEGEVSNLQFLWTKQSQNRCLAQVPLSFSTHCLPSSLPQDRFTHNINFSTTLFSLAEAFLKFYTHMFRLTNYSIYLPIFIKTLE